MLRLRHAALALVALTSLAACGQGIKKYAIPPSNYHSAQLFGDLKYGQQSANQRLDLNIPEGSKAMPLVILVHGGQWSGGDKGFVEVDAGKKLTAAGYAVANIDYRLATESMWPSGVQDVKSAIRWLRTNAARYYLDPNRFAIWGSGAGGYLATAAGVTGDQRTVFDDPATADPNISSAVQAVVAWGPPVDFLSLDKDAKDAGCLYQGHGRSDSDESRWLGGALDQVRNKAERADLLNYVPTAAKLPPFLIVQGTRDCVSPPGQAKALNKALKKAGGRSTLTLVAGSDPTTAKFNKTQIKPGIAFLNQAMP